MHQYLHVFMFVLLFFLVGCFDSGEEGKLDNSSIVVGEKIPSSIIDTLYGTLSNSDKKCTLDVTLDSYTVYEVLVEDKFIRYEVSCSVFTQRGEFLSSDYDIFHADNSGEYKLVFTVNHNVPDSLNPHEFECKIKKYEPAHSNIRGQWYLASEKGSVLGKSSNFIYTPNCLSEAAIVENNFVFRYRSLSRYDSVQCDTILFADWYKERYFNLLDSNRLTITDTCNIGNTVRTFKRLNKDISEVGWLCTDYEIPDEQLGTWYLSYDYRYEYDYYSDSKEVDEDEVEKSYSSAKESNFIMVVTKDSITEYIRNGWLYHGITYEIYERMWYLSELKKSDSNLIRNVVSVGNYNGNYYAEIKELEYIQLTDGLPFDDWTNVNIPDEVNEVEVNKTYSYDLGLSDTMWFKFKVEERKSYTPMVSPKDFSWTIVSYLFDTDKQQFHNSGVNELAQKDGYFYLSVLHSHTHGKSNVKSMPIEIHIKNLW